MKIGIDAHVLGTQAGGNETYMRQLLHALASAESGLDFLAYVNRNAHERGESAAGLPTAPIPIRSSYLRVPLGLPWLVKQTRADLLHVQYTAPPWCPCPFVVSMHDIVAWRFPESMPFADRHRLRLLSGRTLRRAARVFVLTEALRDEIIAEFNLSPSLFDVVQPPSDPLFRPVENADETARVKAKYGLPEDYVLYVGLLQPRKNLARLAEAFARLRERGLDPSLVIVGKHAWLYQEMLEKIDALGLGDRIHFTGYVDREDLPALYSRAAAFAYLSLYEGFGIPVLEALACGTPVLASTDPALVEVAGGAAHHVDPLDVDAIEEGLATVLTDSELRNRLRTEGPHRAAYFTVERMAEAAIAGYQKAMK